MHSSQMEVFSYFSASQIICFGGEPVDLTAMADLKLISFKMCRREVTCVIPCRVIFDLEILPDGCQERLKLKR